MPEVASTADEVVSKIACTADKVVAEARSTVDDVVPEAGPRRTMSCPRSVHGG